MDFNGIIQRVIGMITKTGDEWGKIQGETAAVKDIYLKFAIILFAVPPVCAFLGFLFAGAPFGMALGFAIFLYIFTLVILFVMGILIDVIGPSFGAAKDMITSQKLAVYSMIPYAVVGILFILPIRGDMRLIVGLISLVSFYFMLVGAQKIKSMTQEKAIPLIIIMAVIWFVLYYLATEISTRIAVRMFY